MLDGWTFERGSDHISGNEKKKEETIIIEIEKTAKSHSALIEALFVFVVFCTFVDVM